MCNHRPSFQCLLQKSLRCKKSKSYPNLQQCIHWFSPIPWNRAPSNWLQIQLLCCSDACQFWCNGNNSQEIHAPQPVSKCQSLPNFRVLDWIWWSKIEAIGMIEVTARYKKENSKNPNPHHPQLQDRSPVMGTYGSTWDDSGYKAKFDFGQSSVNSVLGSLQMEIMETMEILQIHKDFTLLFREDIGLIPNYEHSFSLQDKAIPVWLPCRRVPESRAKGTDLALDKMLLDGIIEKIEWSDWIHPMQTVSKLDPNDPVRITVDFSHGINQFVRLVVYPTPRADDIFNQVRKFQFFSS